MKAFVITLRDNDYSEACAERCIYSGEQHGIKVERFDAIDKVHSRQVMEQHGLQWTWPNIAGDVCPFTGLKRHVYKTADYGARIGCSMSHYLLWERCTQLDEPIVILEHDAVFQRELPALPEKFGAIMLNDPAGATPRGIWWRTQLMMKGYGIHDKTIVFEDGRPDGLAGNSAYVISPRAAGDCMDAYKSFGVWPNDATLCRQLVPGLMEVYPFVTETRQLKSTSGGY